MYQMLLWGSLHPLVEINMGTAMPHAQPTQFYHIPMQYEFIVELSYSENPFTV